MKEMPQVFLYSIFFVWGFYLGWKFRGENIAELKRQIKREAEDKKEREEMYNKYFESTPAPKRPDRFS